MARVTIEDCLKKVPNRFELVLLATKRARELRDKEATIPVENDKSTVVALREIAAGNYTKEGALNPTIAAEFADAEQTIIDAVESMSVESTAKGDSTSE